MFRFPTRPSPFGPKSGVDGGPADMVKPSWAKAISARDLKKLQKHLEWSAVWMSNGRQAYTECCKEAGRSMPDYAEKEFWGVANLKSLPWTPALWCAGNGYIEGLKFCLEKDSDSSLEKLLTRFDKTMSVREHIEFEFPLMVQYLPALPVQVPPQPVVVPQPQPYFPAPVLSVPPPGPLFAHTRDNYSPKSETELFIHQNDTVEVLVQDQSGWWQCRRRDGAVGWLPATLLVVVPPPQLQRPPSPQLQRPPPPQQQLPPPQQGFVPPMSGPSPPMRRPPVPEAQLSSPAAAVSDASVEEKIRLGVESMLRQHKLELLELLKSTHVASGGGAATPEQMELRMRVLEAQTQGRSSEIESRMNEQIAAERTQAQEERQRLVMELKRLACDGDTTSATVMGLRQQLLHVEAVQSELVALSRSAKQREEMRQQYGSEPRVWDFYNSLCCRFEEWLLGIKAAASGVVSHDVQSAGGKVGGFMCLLGEICEMVPIVGEFAGVIKLAGAAVEAVDHKRQQSVIERISKFGTLAELQNLSSNLAYSLTRR